MLSVVIFIGLLVMIGSGVYGSCEGGDLSGLDDPFSESDSKFSSFPSPRSRYLAAPDFVDRAISSPRQHPKQYSTADDTEWVLICFPSSLLTFSVFCPPCAICCD